MDDQNIAKNWTLSEANEVIPIMTQAFDGIFTLNGQVESLDKDIAVLHGIWGASLLEPNNPDYSYYKDLRSRRLSIEQRLEIAAIELQKLGCAIDDIKRGVVHFYHRAPRGLVVFCWRYGEQKINHWHEVGWRATRKPVGFAERI